MRRKLCVYTCITGNYDNLHEIQNPEKNVDYYCFTNNKSLQSKTWKIIQIENDGLDNQRLSRKIKMLGHPIISENYDISVWTDASVIWDQSITEFVKTYLKDTPFSAFVHSQRKTVHDEAITCLRLRKDTKERITKTLNFLAEENFPDDLGLYEMTTFIKRHNDPTVIKTMEIWFNTVKTYSKRDQLSFSYAVWKTGLKVTPINLNVWDNTWFHTVKHNSIAAAPSIECHIYYGNPNQNFDFNKYFIYNYLIIGNTYKIDATIENDTDQIEINPTDTIGICYQNILIKPGATNMSFPNSIPCGDNFMFCTNHGIIDFTGDFKKGQKLSFSIDMHQPSISNLRQAIQSVWELRDLTIIEHNKAHSKYSRLASENEQLKNELKNTNRELQNILNSKRWKLFQKARRLFPPY